MAIDGCFLSLIAAELRGRIIGAKVDKIHQPTKEEFVFVLRGMGENLKLFVSVKASGARAHLTERTPQNPKQPFMLCMLMRKHLTGAKLLDIRQIGYERILFFDFEGTNELGDRQVYTLAAELMGRHSNLILMDKESGRIFDSIKRVTAEMSGVRQILPGGRYELPPAPVRHPITTAPETLIDIMKNSGRNIELSKHLGETLEGVSPVLARELAHFCTRGEDVTIFEMSATQLDRLSFILKNVGGVVAGSSAGTPTMISTPEGVLKDVTFIPVSQYGTSMVTRTYDSFATLLDSFYWEKELAERMKSKGGDLLRLIINRIERIERKLLLQEEDLKKCKDRERLKVLGDLLSTYLYAFKKGDKSVTVENYYADPPEQVEIALDVRLTPSQNAQKYYSDYRKADTAEKMLVPLMEEARTELQYFDSVFDLLTRATTDEELSAIRSELASLGYVRSTVSDRQKPVKLPPLKYISSDGFTILAGRNNIQNDQLTLKQASKTDMWLHTQKIPGSHVIIVTDGKQVPNKTIEEAAIISATHSKASKSAKVPVDYTLIRHVKKPSGAKPGMVIYDNFQTAIVDPDKELLEELAVR